MDYQITNKTSLCRICLEDKNEAVSLICNEEAFHTVLEKIALCFHIILLDDKCLPSSICNKCVYELDIAYNFRNKCITLNERLKDLCLEREKTMVNVNSQVVKTQDKNRINDDLNKPVTTYTDKKTLASAQETKEENKEIFQCSICKKKLKTEASLIKHNLSMHLKRKHLGKVTGTGPSRRYHCTKCSYNTPHSQTLVNHMRRHNGDRPYHCECGKTFTQSSSLAAHRKIHSNTMFYTCTVCGKQFKHAFSLKKHQHVHEDGKFSCEICNKQLKSRQSLQDHIHRHYNVRNYSCEDCGDTFVTSSELYNHRKKHSVHKTVECHLCGYKTHTKKNLIIHLKRHTGEKSYKCDNCSLSFYTNGDLQRHQRVHTRNKPYTCPTCSQRFTHSPSLNKHMLSVHGVVYRWANFKWKETKRNKVLEDDVKTKQNCKTEK